MTFDRLHAYLLNKPQAELSFPFGDDVYVYKIKQKMFALIAWRAFPGTSIRHLMLNVKCEPNESLALQDIFTHIKPGYHMDKKHWISLYIPLNDATQSNDASTIPEGEIERIIDNSFLLVLAKLTKSQQASVRLHL